MGSSGESRDTGIIGGKGQKEKAFSLKKSNRPVCREGKFDISSWFGRFFT
jgi:hypothetical protein